MTFLGFNNLQANNKDVDSNQHGEEENRGEGGNIVGQETQWSKLCEQISCDPAVPDPFPTVVLLFSPLDRVGYRCRYLDLGRKQAIALCKYI
jgi:hypothetical protein